MKLKLGHILQATEVVVSIINANRPLPQKGAYRIARLYAKLKPEYDLIAARRNSMIEAYAYKAMIPAGDEAGQEEVEAPNFSVPPDKMAEFTKAWADIAAEEIEVAVEPIPLDQLGDGSSGITAAELVMLDELVRE